MNRLPKILSLLPVLGLLLAISAHAEPITFQFNDGTSLTGEIISKDDNGIKLRLLEGSYSDIIPWARFSQADLLKLQKDPKMEPFVAPFLEISEGVRTTPRPVAELKQPDRLSRPTSKSLIGSLFGSPLGWFLILLMYGANIYAGLEVAVFRAQPRGLVCGVSALLPVVGPIIFLALPRQYDQEPDEAAPVPSGEEALVVNPMQADLPTGQHSSLHLHSEPGAGAGKDPAALPPPEVFTRGLITFNRRFFETRFPKFFGVHHGGDKDKVLVVKSMRKEYVSDRIVRVSAEEMVLQVTHGTASEEITVPYQEIQEVILKHRNAP